METVVKGDDIHWVSADITDTHWVSDIADILILRTRTWLPALLPECAYGEMIQSSEHHIKH